MVRIAIFMVKNVRNHRFKINHHVAIALYIIFFGAKARKNIYKVASGYSKSLILAVNCNKLEKIILNKLGEK